MYLSLKHALNKKITHEKLTHPFIEDPYSVKLENTQKFSLPTLTELGNRQQLALAWTEYFEYHVSKFDT